MIVQHPVDSSSEHSKRRLKFVRGIAYELFLFLESPVGTVSSVSCNLLQLTEFHDIRIYRQATVRLPRSIGIEPIKNLVERAHAFLEHEERGNDNRQQQNEIQREHPPKDSRYKVLFFDGRGGDYEFVAAAFPIPEYGLEKSRRLILIGLPDIEIRIVVLHTGMRIRVTLRDFVDTVMTVCHNVRHGQRLSGQLLDHQLFCITFKQVVGLVIDLIHNDEVENHRPKGYDRKQCHREADCDVVNQFHSFVTSL